MKSNTTIRKSLIYGTAPILAWALWGCDVEQKQEGELPKVDADIKAESGQLPEYEVKKTQEGKLPSVDVDVDAEGGKLPKYEVKTPDVEVGKKEVEVPVPDVDVDTEQKKVTVPSVDVEMPEEEAK